MNSFTRPPFEPTRNPFESFLPNMRSHPTEGERRYGGPKGAGSLVRSRMIIGPQSCGLLLLLLMRAEITFSTYLPIVAVPVDGRAGLLGLDMLRCSGPEAPAERGVGHNGY